MSTALPAQRSTTRTRQNVKNLGGVDARFAKISHRGGDLRAEIGNGDHPPASSPKALPKITRPASFPFPTGRRFARLSAARSPRRQQHRRARQK
jgi:hypothetical protein